MAVIINENTVPKRTMKPIPCPLNLRDQAKKDLDSGERLGIIQRVEQGGSQPLCISPAIFEKKSNWGCRKVGEFQGSK